MMEKYRPKRGEVYYIRYDKSVGSEEAIGRPAVVVSSEQGNATSTTYNCVFLTTAPKTMLVNVPLTSTVKKSWARCNQIHTFDIRRFGNKMCILTEREMGAIDAGLAVALGLNLSDQGLEEEIKALKFEIASLENHISQIKDNYEKKLAEARDVSQVENDVHKRLYEKVLDMLAERRIERDLERRELPIPVTELPVHPATAETEPELVDVNRCEESELRGLGFASSVAKMVIAQRPYLSVEDLRLVPGMTQVGYRLIEKRVTVGDITEYMKKPKAKKQEPVAVPETGKVNVNTATPEELRQKLGMGINLTQSIRAYRNKHGKFTSIEDLLYVPHFGETAMRKYGDRLEV